MTTKYPDGNKTDYFGSFNYLHVVVLLELKDKKIKLFEIMWENPLNIAYMHIMNLQLYKRLCK